MLVHIAVKWFKAAREGKSDTQALFKPLLALCLLMQTHWPKQDSEDGETDSTSKYCGFLGFFFANYHKG